METNKAADTAATKSEEEEGEEELAGVVNTSNVVNFDESRSAISSDSTQQRDPIVVEENKATETALPNKSKETNSISSSSNSLTSRRTTNTNANVLVAANTTTNSNGGGLVKTLSSAVNRKFLLCRRFKDSGGILRNFNSLPLFVYATSPSTHAISADGVGVAKELSTVAAIKHNEKRNQLHVDRISNNNYFPSSSARVKYCQETFGRQSGGEEGLECLADDNSHNICNCIQQMEAMAAATTNIVGSSNGTTLGGNNLMYPNHLHQHHNLLHQHHQQQQQHLLSHQIPYSNNYHPLHHSNSHQNIHSEQTKSLQELQHEVGALLEFRDLVIETFPDLKQKMASMSSANSQSATINNPSSVNGHHSNSSNGNPSSVLSNPSTLSGTATNATMRREWEPGIRPKRKIQKNPSNSNGCSSGNVASGGTSGAGNAAAGDNCSSLPRSRSNSHSGKKEPKSGENNNGSVVQDSGFSTETSSSKEGHSASSSNGALPASHPLTRISADADDELLNLLDVIHRKSSRLREEVEHLQTYERHNLHNSSRSQVDAEPATTASETIASRINGGESLYKHLTPKTFREHVDRLNREDIKQLRRERDRLLDKLAEMEAETLTGRIKAAKMNDRVEELVSVKKDLEEQLKLAMAQKLELSCRLQQIQQQQQTSKSSSSQSENSSHRSSSLSATTVLSTTSTTINNSQGFSQVDAILRQRQQNTFQPLHQQQSQNQNQNLQEQKIKEDALVPFHQSVSSDNFQSQQNIQHLMLGHLDGIISNPGSRNSKSRSIDSKRFSAILLEGNVLELRRHLLTLTVTNQGLASKLDKTSKSNNILFKRLEKQKEDIEDLRFQLEEKNIELEGTKAQLRIIESRYPSATPISNTTINSYLNSHQDYETNRSSASTTLVLSRRSGASGIDSNIGSGIRSSTPQALPSSNGIPDFLSEMPTPITISTPSMKAMIPLPLDDLQHSSSTESAQDHDLTTSDTTGNGAKIMSSSVGHLSPFEQTSKTLTPTQQALKKFIGNSGSKPSKIPLPGSGTKAAAYFAGKPPTGRSTTNAGRSPPSANGSYTSNKSLSRSTGNLLFNKSPNNSTTSLSTNTSRSSTNSSSIPLAVTPYSIASRVFSSTSTSASPSNAMNSSPSSSAATITTTTTTPPAPTSTITTIGATTTTTNTHNNPSSRILQNSPLPKLKRETFSSRIRHLDSLSRAHYQQQQQQQNEANTSSNELNFSNGNGNHSNSSSNSSYIISSTPKPSAIAAQINSSIRKELQLSSNSFTAGSQSIFRRPTTSNFNNGNQTHSTSNGSGGGVSSNSGSGLSPYGSTMLQHSSSSAARRFSSASIVGARVAAARNHDQQQSKQTPQQQQSTVNDYQGLHHYHQNSNGGGNSGNASNASDSDSGKVRTLKSTLFGWFNKS